MTPSRRLACALALLLSVGAGCRRATQHDAPTAPVILFFGDSITRGQGLDEKKAFPAVIQARLGEAGLDYRCVNAGVSGETTEQALARVASYADLDPRVVMVELGANDGWRGLNRLQTKSNLLKIVRAFSERGARVILAGTQFPHLQHPAYALPLGRVFEEVAEQTDADLIPDLMKGVAGVRNLNQEDGVHPTAEGQQRLADNAWPAVERALQSSH